MDCGPGTLDDGSLHVKLITDVVSLTDYIVVDVNSSLIDDVVQGLVLGDNPIRVASVSERFENLSREKLGIPDNSDALFMFGSTGMNFDPLILRKVIKNLTRAGDMVSLQALIRNEGDNSCHVARYQNPSIVEFTFGPIEVLGGTLGQFSAEFRWMNDRVEFCFRAMDRVFLALPRMPLFRGRRSSRYRFFAEAFIERIYRRDGVSIL